jgi:hypothetical protein
MLACSCNMVTSAAAQMHITFFLFSSPNSKTVSRMSIMATTASPGIDGHRPSEKSIQELSCYDPLMLCAPLRAFTVQGGGNWQVRLCEQDRHHQRCMQVELATTTVLSLTTRHTTYLARRIVSTSIVDDSLVHLYPVPVGMLV